MVDYGHGLIRFSFHLESFYLKSDSCVRGSKLSVSRVPETNVSRAQGAVAFGPPRARGGVELICRRRVFFLSRPYLSFNLRAYGNSPLRMGLLAYCHTSTTDRSIIAHVFHRVKGGFVSHQLSVVSYQSSVISRRCEVRGRRRDRAARLTRRTGQTRRTASTRGHVRLTGRSLMGRTGAEACTTRL